MSNPIKNSVRDFVVDYFLFGDGDALQDDTSFLDEGIIDSTGILELVAFLEETCTIVVKDEELIPENLDSIANIMQFLEKKQRS